MKDRSTKISKFLSVVLRHEPDKIGLKLDDEGWTSVSELLSRMRVDGDLITFKELLNVVVMNDKQRFSFSDDKTLIRANQGHSVQVKLGYEPLSPPAVLYHGTAERFLSSIERQGLLKGQRHHVHLSDDVRVATEVGARYGRPIVLIVASERMTKSGHLFFRSENGVWLTEHVPVEYIQFP
ncbi:MAG TPA: RNA 2'-phosphotransferase [Pyrinomonadaceae bacterium]|nr:RNA 2'-phosphotransferase [Pyrinomonadaceae bacterium]